jgi:hypothetical protein
VGQLKQLYHFLQAHRILLIAVDGYQGRPVQIPDGDLSFRMVPGAVRLAARVNAIVVPCLISGDRPLGVTIHFGTPAPAADVADKEAQAAACAHLLREFLPILRAQPEQFTFELMNHFRALEALPGPAVAQPSGVLP